MFLVEIKGEKFLVLRMRITEGEAVFVIDCMGQRQEISQHECKPVAFGVSSWASRPEIMQDAE